MEQPETTLVARPFKDYMKNTKGWHVENVHGNQFSSLPFDCIAVHSKYDIRCIEFKREGKVSLSPNQKKKLPIWLLNGAKIWFIVAEDLRGNLPELERQYAKLFAPPNAAFYLTSFHRSFRI